MKRDGVEWDTDFEETFFQLVSRRMNMRVLAEYDDDNSYYE